MKCLCGEEMRGLGGYDSGSCNGHPSGGDVAWNLYCCDDCGNVARQNVWDNPGVVWILFNQNPIKEGGL